MSRDPPTGFWLAFLAANGGMPPLTDEEKAEFNTLRAREMARAEERRTPPQPQLDLAA